MFHSEGPREREFVDETPDSAGEPHEHRVICVAKFQEAVYVLHCFEKKTQKTSQQDLNKARAAYAEMQKIRRG